MTPEFDEPEEILEFVEVRGSHTREALAIVVEKLLTELKLRQKLFTITGITPAIIELSEILYSRA